MISRIVIYCWLLLPEANLLQRADHVSKVHCSGVAVADELHMTDGCVRRIQSFSHFGNSFSTDSEANSIYMSDIFGPPHTCVFRLCAAGSQAGS